MMTSNTADSNATGREAFVWIWLPEDTEPVVAGKLEADDQGNVQFNYGNSYLGRISANPPAISIYEPELGGVKQRRDQLVCRRERFVFSNCLESSQWAPTMSIGMHNCYR